MERRLKAALAEKPLPPVTHPTAWYGSAAASVSAMASVAAAAASGGAGGVGGDANRSKALSSVRIVETVSAVHPAFADFHAASLMELVKVLSRQHFLQASVVATSLATRRVQCVCVCVCFLSLFLPFPPAGGAVAGRRYGSRCDGVETDKKKRFIFDIERHLLKQARRVYPSDSLVTTRVVGLKQIGMVGTRRRWLFPQDSSAATQ